MNILITMAIVIFIAACAGLTFLFARRHSWQMALVRTGVVVASAIISVPIAKAGAFSAGFFADGQLAPLFPDALKDYFGDVPLAEESVVAILSLIVAVVLYITVFLVLRYVLSLLANILEKLVPALRYGKGTHRGTAGGIGAINGVLIALVILMPICCFTTVAVDTSNAFFDRVEINELESLSTTARDVLSAWDQVADEVDDSAVRAVSTVGSPLYRWLTTTDLADGEIEFNLGDEIIHLGKTAGDVVVATKVLDGGFTEADKDKLFVAGDTLLASPWVSELGAETLSYIGKHWGNGESALGLDVPESPALVQPTMLVMYDILATESTQTIKGDLHTLMDVVGTLAANGFFDGEVDPATLMVRLAERVDDTDAFNLVERLQSMLEANAHLAPLSEEIDAMTGRVVSSVLSAELRDNPRYAPVVNQVTEKLNEALAYDEDTRNEVIRDVVKDAFQSEGIVVPEDVAVNMTDEIMETCGADGEIAEDEVREYLANRMETDTDTVSKIIKSNDLSAFVTETQ